MRQQTYKIPQRKYWISDGSMKSLQEIPLLLLQAQDKELSIAQSNTQINTWIEKAKLQDKQLGIRRSTIPCLPISILAGENSQSFFNISPGQSSYFANSRSCVVEKF